MTTCLGWPDNDALPITLAEHMEGIIRDNPLDVREGLLHNEEGVDLILANIRLSEIQDEKDLLERTGKKLSAIATERAGQAVKYTAKTIETITKKVAIIITYCIKAISAALRLDSMQHSMGFQHRESFL